MAAGNPRKARLAAVTLIFAVSLAGLIFEVSLTRAFSVLLRYHFVFLAISLATCGIGIGGLADFLLRMRAPRLAHAPLFIPAVVTALAATYPLALVLLFATPLSAHLTSVWVVSACCLPPFLLAGVVLSHLFAEYSALSGRLYFADLSGAALGTVLVIAILQVTGAINSSIVCGILVAAGLAAYALLSSLRRPLLLGSGMGALLIVALVVNISAKVVDLPLLPLTDDPLAKPLYRDLATPSVRLEHSDWNAFARTDVTQEAGADGKFRPDDDRYIYTDGEVPTNMIRFDGDLNKLRDRLSGFIGFFPFREERPKTCMLIGPGGGLDILLAEAVGATDIDGAELNPSIPRIVRAHRDFAGPIYDYSNVHISVDEGRSYVRRSDKRYDIIYMALTKTATTASSSLALVESYANTVEAFQAYYDHLSDRGCLAFVCQSEFILMRTMLTALDAMQARGVSRQEALRHVALVSVQKQFYQFGPYRHMLLMYRKPLSEERARFLAKQAIGLELEPGFFPGAFEPEPFSWLTQHNVSNAQFVTDFNAMAAPSLGNKVDLMPCGDDKPFMMDFTYGIPAQFNVLVLCVAAAAVLLSVIAVIALLAVPGFGTTLPRLLVALVYFSLLGVAFMLVEVCLSQKLVLYLGYPVLTLSVILFSLLLGGGVGSYVTQSWPVVSLRRRAAVAALGVTLLTLALQFGLPHLVEATLRWQILSRCAMTMALLLPLGFCMGMPFPTGLRIVGKWSEMTVPWVWGLNGLTSVIGSVGAMGVAKLYGFSAVFFAAATLYLVAAGAVMLIESRK